MPPSPPPQQQPRILDDCDISGFDPAPPQKQDYVCHPMKIEVSDVLRSLREEQYECFPSVSDALKLLACILVQSPCLVLFRCTPLMAFLRSPSEQNLPDAKTAARDASRYFAENSICRRVLVVMEGVTMQNVKDEGPDAFRRCYHQADTLSRAQGCWTQPERCRVLVRAKNTSVTRSALLACEMLMQPPRWQLLQSEEEGERDSDTRSPCDYTDFPSGLCIALRH